ncbi:AI-2E family transporter [Adlercreutzia sp. ZJ141]|uniref:AI-2E family transporter n=1 Tax=Adlercreutzia sp. ZJ141 TaxID=2709406 RepID=UPI0013EAD734|nr:AI-2E family transporter [Adlercreutzia sp. ZJ141]
MIQDFLKSPKWETTRMTLMLLLVLTFAFMIATNLSKVFVFFGNVWDACLPFIVGLAVAYVLNLLMVKWEKIYFPNSSSKVVERTRRPVCLLLSVAVVISIISIVSYFAASELTTAILAIGEGLTAVVDIIEKYVGENSHLYALISGEPDVWSEYLRKIVDGLGGADNITSSITKVGSGLLSVTVNTIVAFVFSLYILIDKERALDAIRSFGKTILPNKTYASVSHTLSVANGCFGRFVYGQCIEACILGTLCAIGLTIFDFPFAAPIGLIVGATSIIPIVGAWVGGAVGAFMILSVSPQQAIMFLVFLVVLQQLESNLIYPKVVGTSVGVPGILVLMSVFIGGGLFGVAGILLAVPMVSTVLTLLADKRSSKDQAHRDIDESMYVIDMRSAVEADKTTGNVSTRDVIQPTDHVDHTKENNAEESSVDHSPNEPTKRL